MARPAILSAAKHLMVCLGSIHITCGPLGFLQLVAWTGMLATYSMEDGIAKGVADTFSGERPCTMCIMIAESATDQSPAPEAPHPDRNSPAPSLGHHWQSPRSICIAPPPARNPNDADSNPFPDEMMVSILQSGPETPPPRISLRHA